MTNTLKAASIFLALITAIGCMSSNKKRNLPTSNASTPPSRPPAIPSAEHEVPVITEEVVQRALQSAVDRYELMRKRMGKGTNGTPWPQLRSIDGLVGARIIKYVPPAPEGKRWHLDTLNQRVELKDRL